MTTQKYPDRKIVLTPEDQEQILFRWITLKNKSYYQDKYGQHHTIPALDQPRMALIQSIIDGKVDKGIVEYGPDCERMGFGSMGKGSTERYVKNKLLPHYKDIKEGVRPFVYLVERRDGKFVLEDGNHRICFAHAMGINWEALVRDYREKYRRRWADTPPKLYQNIYIDRELICNGQRQDSLARMDSVEQKDVEDKRVIVLGCNNGHDCFLTCERGASFAMGLDNDGGLIAYALMANTYFSYPCDFDVADLSKAWTGEQFDTALVFSLYDSIPDQGVLIKTIQQAGCETVYFEGHCLTDLKGNEPSYRARYTKFLSHFGEVHPVWHDRFNTRWMYRCEW